MIDDNDANGPARPHVPEGDDFTSQGETPAAGPQSDDEKDSRPLLFTRLSLLYSLAQIFDGGWAKLSLIIPGVVALLPIIGNLLVLGYQFDAIENAHRRRHSVFPVFELNNFSMYVERGVWPFVLQMVLQLILMPPYLIFTYGSMGILMLVQQTLSKDMEVLVITSGLILMYVVIFGFAYVLALILVPLNLRVGLTQDFRQVVHFRWCLDFIRRTWLETTLILIFIQIVAGLVMVTGLALCCVGIFPAVTIVVVMQGHLMYQLYEIFLSRGGEPVPFQPDSPAAPNPLPPPHVSDIPPATAP